MNPGTRRSHLIIVSRPTLGATPWTDLDLKGEAQTVDGFVELPWRMAPASAVMALGALLIAVGARRSVAGTRRSSSTSAISFVHGLRLSILGLVVVGLGASWAWSLLWLFVVALAVLAEELLETSVVLWALKRRYASATGGAPSGKPL